MVTPVDTQPPTYTLVINGVDLTAYIEDASWTITQNWGRQGDTATFYLWDEHAAGGSTFTVPPLSTIVLTDTTLNQVLFSGLVTFPEMYYQAPTLQKWELQCTDWTYMSDRATVFGDYSTQSADQIVRSLVALNNLGITTNNVQQGPTIPRIQFVYLSLSDALKEVCLFAGANSTFGWYIDENRDLHFYDENQAGAPVAFFSDSGSDFQNGVYVPGYTGNYYTDYYYGWDATSIRNSVDVRGGLASATYTEGWVGSGNQDTWPLTYTPDPQSVDVNDPNGAVDAPKFILTVGGVANSVSFESGTSATTDWVIISDPQRSGGLLGNAFLQINVNRASPPPPPYPPVGTVMSLTYNYLYPVICDVRDTASISEFSSLPNGGVFASVITDTNLLNLLAAIQRGRREVNSYSLPQERVTFNTDESFSGHVRAGQIIIWKNGFVADSQNSYAPGINDKFLVVQNQISGKLSGYRSYQITATRVAVGASP
jgi:hypothetical protein